METKELPEWRIEDIVSNKTCKDCGYADQQEIDDAIRLEKTAEHIRKESQDWQTIMQSDKNVFTDDEKNDLYWLLRQLETLSV